ncbi:MAG: hypothetical protein M3680_06985 [Myxococcota bacterium]|nr:hypothetical protein [Myxococcota bacterium]
MRTLALLACFGLWSCGDRQVGEGPADRRAALERQLREQAGEPLLETARAYRELRAEHPDALRVVAEAFGRRGEREARFEVLRTLIMRGQGTVDDRLVALDLALELGRVDEATYASGLGWLDEALAAEPWCQTFELRVRWTVGRAEHERAIEQGLAGCPRDQERARWLALRVAAGSAPGTGVACEAVVHGAVELARTCIDHGTPGWQQEVARALLDDDRPRRLAAAGREPDVPVFVLLELARTPEVPVAERCAALAAAQRRELGWLPRAGHAAAIAGRYDGPRRALSCP